MRNPNLPNVLVYSKNPLPEIKTFGRPWEEDSFHINQKEDDGALYLDLLNLNPDVIVTVGDKESDFGLLFVAPENIRKKWIHFNKPEDVDGDKIYWCYTINAIQKPAKIDKPVLVSIFTPVYNTGKEKLQRLHDSIKSQSYKTIEWVIVDDHSTDESTVEFLKSLQETYPISVYVKRLQERSGRIGEVKGIACSVSKGEILVEVDHDDMLTPDCIRWIVEAHQKHPEAGFFYTDCTERYESHDGCHDYGDNYGLGYGKAVWETHPNYEKPGTQETRSYLVQKTPPINEMTLRHIVGVPNHVRAFTRKVYEEVGGYSSLIVADDYELILRLFLKTRFCHIPKLGYIQFYNDASVGNTQKSRNKEIQRSVKYIARYYQEAINNRIIELGGVLDTFKAVNSNNPNNIFHLTYTPEG